MYWTPTFLPGSGAGSGSEMEPQSSAVRIRLADWPGGHPNSPVVRLPAFSWEEKSWRDGAQGNGAACPGLPGLFLPLGGRYNVEHEPGPRSQVGLPDTWVMMTNSSHQPRSCRGSFARYRNRKDLANVTLPVTVRIVIIVTLLPVTAPGHSRSEALSGSVSPEGSVGGNVWPAEGTTPETSRE